MNRIIVLSLTCLFAFSFLTTLNAQTESADAEVDYTVDEVLQIQADDVTLPNITPSANGTNSSSVTGNGSIPANNADTSMQMAVSVTASPNTTAETSLSIKHDPAVDSLDGSIQQAFTDGFTIWQGNDGTTPGDGTVLYNITANGKGSIGVEYSDDATSNTPAATYSFTVNYEISPVE